MTTEHPAASTRAWATANWSHVEDGRITAIHVTFDAREITAAG